MNADAGIVHCKFNRMHVNYRIPINRSTDHWKCHRPLELLIKELHVTKKMSLLLVEEQREWRRRRFRQLRENEWTRERVSHKKTGWRLHFANFSRRWEVARFFGPLFSSFSSWVAILARPAIFPFDSHETRARGCTRTYRNFLELQVCMSNMCAWTCISRLLARASTRIRDKQTMPSRGRTVNAIPFCTDVSNWRLKT